MALDNRKAVFWIVAIIGGMLAFFFLFNFLNDVFHGRIDFEAWFKSQDWLRWLAIIVAGVAVILVGRWAYEKWGG